MINKVILVGRLGRDPELRHTQGGKAVCSFSVATNGYSSGEKTTEWHKVTCWERQAEFVSQYLSKGRLVYLEGRLATREWTDQTGAKRMVTEVVAYVVQALDSGGSGGTEARAPAEGGRTGREGPAVREALDRAAASPSVEDEDIPF